MTEIKIEKKKLVWPWILLGVGVITALVYFLAFNDYKEKINEVPKTSELVVTKEADPISVKETELISIKENNSTVATYVNFVETDKDKMDLHHAYTNEALFKLSEATNAMAGEVEYEVRSDLEKVKEYAEIITKDPFETTHADNIREAANILTKVLQNIQKAKYPGLNNEVAELKSASEAIKPGVLTLDQRNEVKTFFSKAADLLKKMN